MDNQPGSFGERLRRYREAAAYSQEKLAERAGLTANAIGALERGERKHPYPDTVRRLADALGLSAPERAELAAAVSQSNGRGTVALGSGTPSRESARLPGELTPLIGREREVEVVLQLISRPRERLLTLTGPGGVGKTRLALHVAGAVAQGDDFPDGVTWVSLAPLVQPGLVAPAIARSLGLREMPGQDPLNALSLHLRDRRGLLVLDNFEHVIDAAQGVAELLLTCPGLHVLATSRAPLRVSGEQEYAVPPLELPRIGQAQHTLSQDPVASVQLFVRRAQAVSPTFDLNQENVAAVAAICYRLDGLPLALELAAARVKLLAPAELLERLDRALPLLSGGARDLPERQRTIESAIKWSYDLLRPPEQALFRRLSIFAGGWTLAAAEVVGSGDDVPAENVLDFLGRLVEQSLVVAEQRGDGTTRYRLLEPVRQYARRLLDDCGETEPMAQKHTAYHLQFAERAKPELFGPHMVEWLKRIEAEHDNLRTAISWALTRGQPELAARLAYSLSRFFWQRGQLEALRWMEDVLASSAPVSAGARARATYVAQLMRYRFGGVEGLVSACQDAAPVLLAEGDVAGASDVLMLAGAGSLRAGDAELAMKLLHESLDLSESVGDEQGMALALAFIGGIPLSRGEYEQAEEYCERGLELARRSGNALSMYPPLYNLALAAQGKGEYGRAYGYYVELLEVAEHMGDTPLVGFAVMGIAECAAAQGDPGRAARLYGAADAVFASVGMTFHPLRTTIAFHDRFRDLARGQLGAEDFEAVRAEGRAMTLEEALEYALDEVAGGREDLSEIRSQDEFVSR